jgi:beta-ureidopropionase
VFVPVASYGFRQDLFLAELQTRAAESGVFVFAVNRAGPERVDFDVTMFGSSCIVDPTGHIVARGSSGSESRGCEVVRADIDLSDVQRARIRVPYLRDRRPEVYHLDARDPVQRPSASSSSLITSIAAAAFGKPT